MAANDEDLPDDLKEADRLADILKKIIDSTCMFCFGALNPTPEQRDIACRCNRTLN